MILKKFINKIYLTNGTNEAASSLSKQNQITESPKESKDIINERPTIARDHCDCKQKVCLKIRLNYLNKSKVINPMI